MNLAWVTDIHLNFLDAPGIAAFCERIAATGAEGVIVSGDISEAHELASHLELLAAHLTHGAGVYRPRANVEVRTGGADYGAPEVQSPLIT